MKIPSELVTVARHLGHLKQKTVFVGGMIRGLLITDPAAGAARPTDDVDLIVDVPSYQAFTELNEDLRGLGFSESMEEGAPISRWGSISKSGSFRPQLGGGGDIPADGRPRDARRSGASARPNRLPRSPARAPYPPPRHSLTWEMP